MLLQQAMVLSESIPAKLPAAYRLPHKRSSDGYFTLHAPQLKMNGGSASLMVEIHRARELRAQRKCPARGADLQRMAEVYSAWQKSTAHGGSVSNMNYGIMAESGARQEVKMR